MKHLIKEKITPNRVIFKDIRYKITRIDPKYITNEFIIETDENNIVQNLFLPNSKHPNCRPENNKFCVPDGIRQLSFPLDRASLFYIQNMLEVFNLDACYYLPDGLDFDFEYYHNNFVVNNNFLMESINEEK